MGMSATACAKRAGISYRQFDHWARNGYIPSDDVLPTAPGSGFARTVTEEQADFTSRLAKLVRAGIPVSKASKLLVSLDPEAVEFQLTPEVKVTLL